ncbi:hypothetical protein TCAL_11029 [Tigriopus californicus]|uniref:Major facilitator superfamily (MFS) profile domain-containing protein n=2 Tax=Tigriopus californicus TaxID=6832 RepID=A0A553NDM7_TIGCA|nr:hypothetical protein TCAL_11029 [Tigriopus californicus]|eukprot:TCALIF_11029-PA protein Name:"Similar to Orct Organic cation transporter protein (Drosophila melanogaster)" AED:0.26 eAED:0.26 QI:0/-1/0/1/-1/1/1/0/571
MSENSDSKDLVSSDGKDASDSGTRNRVTFDDVLVELGEFGTYQKIFYFLFSVPFVVSSMQLLGWVFVGANLPHRCRFPDEPTDLETPGNFDFVSDTYVSVDGCSYINLISNETLTCDLGYIYDTSIIGDSVVKDWDLICDRKSWRATIGAAPMVGYLIGGLLTGYQSDKFGRKPTFISSIFLLFVSGLATAFVPGFFSFTLARSVVGYAIAGIDNTCFTMGLELVGPSKRTLAGIACWFFETSGLLCAVALAFLLSNNWRLLQICYSLPCIIFISYWWFAPESIRWLIGQGKREEAKHLIQKSAHMNKVNLSDGLIEDMENTLEEEMEEEESRTYTFVDLFRYPQMRIKSVIILICWLVCPALYYVLLLDQSEISTNPHIGFFITCAVQIPGYIFVIFTLERKTFGRKRSQCAYLLLTGLMLIVHPLVPEECYWLRISFSIFGRFCANCAYTVLNLYSAELYPTVVRGVGIGSSYVISRVGTILSPYLLLLGEMSPIIFGSGAFLAGISALLLPETLGKPLPETLLDGERMQRVILPFCKDSDNPLDTIKSAMQSEKSPFKRNLQRDDSKC